VRLVFFVWIGVTSLAFASSIHGSEMSGFGRIIFSFERLPVIETNQINGVLILNFDRPIDLDPSRLGFEIPNYISAIENTDTLKPIAQLRALK